MNWVYTKVWRVLMPENNWLFKLFDHICLGCGDAREKTYPDGFNMFVACSTCRSWRRGWHELSRLRLCQQPSAKSRCIGGEAGFGTQLRWITAPPWLIWTAPQKEKEAAAMAPWKREPKFRQVLGQTILQGKACQRVDLARRLGMRGEIW